MKHELGDKKRIEHLLEAISDLELFLKDVDFDSFKNNKEKQSAVERKLEIIGEATNHISEKIIFHPEISTPWRQIINTRNIIIHEYFRVDIEIIFKIATEEIIPLKKNIQTILKDLEKYLK
jgi:uncharacterized protein with HEPN domain